MGAARPAVRVVAADAGRVARAIVEAVPLAASRSDNPSRRWSTIPDGGTARRTPLVEQIGECLVREETVTLSGEEGVDGALGQRLGADAPHLAEEVPLACRPFRASSAPPDRKLQRCNSLRSGRGSRIETGAKDTSHRSDDPHMRATPTGALSALGGVLNRESSC